MKITPHQRVTIIALTLITCFAMQPSSARQTITAKHWPVTKETELINPAIEQRITSMLAQMSLEEKVGQMIQADISTITPEDLYEYPLGSILAGGNSGPHGDDRASAATWLKLVNEFRAASVKGHSAASSIPVMFGIDAVHGHNNIPGAVIYPHNIGLGATADPELLKKIGQATGDVVAATGINWVFAPTLAVPQDIRWGRTYEGYSEDPQWVASYAAPMVLGLQGPIDSPRLAATAKHFVADGGTDKGIDQGNTLISENELINIHAAGYPPAIEAGVMTVMASYSSWNDVKLHSHHELISTALKQRMGFQGFVVGDWNGHGQVPGCSNESCATAYNAGIDMLMAPDSWRGLYKNTLDQARSGTIPAARINDAVRRILRIKIRLGLLDGKHPEANLQQIGKQQYRQLAREAVRKSLVLLKNNGVLPIKAGSHVLICGPGADNLAMQSGGWTISWQGDYVTREDFPNATTIYQGLKTAIEEAGGTVSLSANGEYKSKPDVAVFVFGEKPYAEMQGDLKLPMLNSRMPLRTLQTFKARGIPTATILLSGRPLWMSEEIQASDAFVAAWLPGSEGQGIADVLVANVEGKTAYNFSGRLPFTWPKTPTKPTTATETEYQRGYGLTYPW